MDKSVKEFVVLLTELNNAILEDLGKEAICTPAIKVFHIALHHEPWLAWELAVQLHLGEEKYNQVMCVLYEHGELGMGEEKDELMLSTHYFNVENREKEIGGVCENCYKRIKYGEPAYSLNCSIDCLFEKEVGAITVPTELAPIKPVCLIVTPVQ